MSYAHAGCHGCCHGHSWTSVADSTSGALVDNFWNVDKGFFNLRSNENESSGINYWPQAHAMDVVVDAYVRTGDSRYAAMFDKWFEGIKLQNGEGSGYQNDFYDDEAWVALTMTRLYNVSQDKKYLDVARELYDDIAKGWNTEYAKGGVAWRKSQPWSKNACINGPMSLLAFKLYKATGDRSYAEFGLKVYKWLRENLIDLSTGFVADNIDGRTGKVNPWSFTYNQGTAMAAALEAYRYSGTPDYLADARLVAHYGITSPKFVDAASGVMLYEDGNVPGEGDGALFRAVFFRYLYDMATAAEIPAETRAGYVRAMNVSADSLRACTDSRGCLALFHPDWRKVVKPGESGTLNAQVSVCTLMETLGRME